MKKIIGFALGFIGLGLIVYSVMNGWASWTQSTQFGQGIPVEPTIGFKYWQGIVAFLMGIAGFAMLFFKPKMAAIPGIIASAVAALAYVKPPMLEDIQLDPQKGIFLAVAGGVLIAIAGLITPKRA